MVKIFLITLVIFALVQPSYSGTITGTFLFTKSPPDAAVVYIRDMNAPSHVAEIDQKGIQFTKKFDVSSTGTDVIFTNSDPVKHNLFANSYKTDTKFDVGLIPPNKAVEIPVQWPEDTLIRIGCKIHRNMRTYIANIKSEKYTIVDFVRKSRWKSKKGFKSYSETKRANKADKYDFKLLDVPDDTKSVTIMLPHTDLIEVELELSEEKEVIISRRGKQLGTLKLMLNK